MNYDKKIRYLDFYENEQRVKNAGYVKIEIMDELCNLQITVTGLSPSENSVKEVHLISDKRKDSMLGEIQLQSGKGSLIKKRISAKQLCPDIAYDHLTKVRIDLGKDRKLICNWKEEADTLSDNMQEKSLDREALPKQELQAKLQQEPQTKLQQEQQVPLQQEPQKELQSELPQEEPSREELQEEFAQEEPPQKELIQEEAPRFAPKEKRETLQSRPLIPPPLQEKKWRQLSEIYPHIAPFRDERDYLSIGLSDFVVLPEKYYRLINNSFLIHSYYNYGHMVLARMVKRGEEAFYIGAPGNFYEKERQVAILFGFESFECRKEPANEGDFGYYMIRVEL